MLMTTPSGIPNYRILPGRVKDSRGISQSKSQPWIMAPVPLRFTRIGCHSLTGSFIIAYARGLLEQSAYW
jgi:hypothetical protein